MEIDFNYIFRTWTQTAWAGTRIRTKDDVVKNNKRCFQKVEKKLIYIRELFKNKFKVDK